MNQIERYTQFAIDNWYSRLEQSPEYEVDWYWDVIHMEEVDSKYWVSKYDSYLPYITSKPFLEAIARGVWNKTPYKDRKEHYKNSYKQYKVICNVWREDIFWALNVITQLQAIAIRENELDTFITTLLWTN